MKKILFILYGLLICASIQVQAQSSQICIFDNDNQLPIAGAMLQIGDRHYSTNDFGQTTVTKFGLYQISALGYNNATIQIQSATQKIGLNRNNQLMQEVVISANREQAKKTQSPIAIGIISPKVMIETKPTTLDQVVNKISGAYMVNLGNEQHSMAIRQPMSTRATYLYLEDGIAIRTSGVFNHNAMLEQNMAATKSIEVIKGPSSSLYGGEAIGGAINIITQTGTVTPQAKVSLQGNNIGYKRVDLQTGYQYKKWSGNVSGYIADRKNGFIERSDFNKKVITARLDHQFTSKTKWENSLTYLDYYSDMSGGVDSTMFANKQFSSKHTFTYRIQKSLRYRTSLFHEWNNHSKTTFHAVYRWNEQDMNATFRITDDYKPATRRGNKALAHGEISNNQFKSYNFIAQHKQSFQFWNSLLIGGASLDISPNIQKANYIRIKKDTLSGMYVSYENKADSLLTYYKNDILNSAAFLHSEFSPIKPIRIVAAIRYDYFRYQFDNQLKPSSFSGAADTVNSFKAWSPKIGLTYTINNNVSLYANFSRGFVPPQVSELYRGVKVPNLQPSTYDNYEVGGWYQIIPNQLSVDFSAYELKGKNTIISVRFDDGTFGNANAGKTHSRGIEMGINGTVVKDIQFRFSGSYAKHSFDEYVERGVKLSGNEINNAPRWISNAEITYRPSQLPGFRTSLEWQKMGSYFMDQANTVKYDGFDVLNLRIGYRYKQAEIWCNVINLLDAYYAINASKSAFGYNYTVAEPRNFNLGISFDFGTLFQ